MKRGSRLFIELSAPSLKQRSREENIQRRNTKIFHRFYYYSQLKQYRYERVLNELANDFDMAVATIQDILQDNANEVRAVRNKQLTIRQLRRAYPVYAWN